jgi:Cu/Zn superoxide dismutase
MKIGQNLWIAAACVMALAACKKSDSGSNTGTGGGTSTSTGGGTSTSTGGSGTSTGGTGTGTAGKAAGTGGSGTAGTSASGGKAVATIAGFGTGTTVTGTATFTQTGNDVTVVVELKGCVETKMYPVHIHEGTSCTDATSQGAHWGMAVMPVRGEGIPKVTCMGTTGTGTYTRMMATDPSIAWTVGGDTTTNVVGHAFVVHDPEPVVAPAAPPRIGCGVIAKQ